MGAHVTRRALLKDVGIAGGALAVLGCGPAAMRPGPAVAAAGGVGVAGTSAYTLPPLPYGYAALAPHIDERTLRLHHDKHHAGYVKGLNAALGKLQAAAAAGDYTKVKYFTRDAAFHGSGHVLHSLYWANMAPGGGGRPAGETAGMIDRDFGSHDGFAKTFAAVTGAVAGSGWGVLAYEPVGRRLVVTGVEKHENIDIVGSVPLLVCDVWEHAYYLHYQNRRGDYIKAFLAHLADWNAVAKRLAVARKLT